MSTHIKTLLILIGIMFGIVCGEFSSFATEIGLWSLSLASIQAVLFFLAKKRVGNLQFLYCSTIVSFVCVGIFIGILRMQFVEEKSVFLCEKSCSFDGKIISSLGAQNGFQIFTIKPLVKDMHAYNILVKTSLYPSYHVGEVLHLKGKVIIPDMIYPHFDKEGFDYLIYMHNKDAGSEMMYPEVSIFHNNDVSFLNTLVMFKDDMVRRIRLYVSYPASSLASGILFGSSSVSSELLSSFRSAGLSHIVVLSGFNIVILIAFVIWILAVIPLFARVIFAVFFVICFVVMVGASTSVVRATIMATISLLAMVSGRQYVARQALLLSLLLIIMYKPESLIYDISLHLSFLATAGLVYMSETCTHMFRKYCHKKIYKMFEEVFVTSFSAYVATLPYVMYVFGKVSVYALLANFLVVPFIPFVMLVSFVVVVSSYFFQPLALVFGFLNTEIIDGIIGVVRFIERLPFSTVQVSFSFFEMCVTYFFMIGIFLYIFNKKENETEVTREGGNITAVISY